MAKWENDIDNLFKDSLHGAEITPPPAVKSNLNKSLFGKGYFRIASIIGVLLLLLGGSVATWFYINHNNNERLAANSNQQNEVIQAQNLEKVQKKTQSSNKLNNSLSTPHMVATDDLNLQPNDHPNQNYITGNPTVTKTNDTYITSSMERTNSKGLWVKDRVGTDKSKEDEISFLSDKNVKSSKNDDAVSTENKNIGAKALKYKALKYNTSIVRKSKELKMKNSEVVNGKLLDKNQRKDLDLRTESLDLDVEKIDVLTISRNNQLIEIALPSNRFKAKPRFELITALGISSNTYGLWKYDEAGNEFTTISSPNYQFHLQGRMNIKNWYVSSGINYNYKYHDLTRSFSFSQTVQTGTEMQIDSTWTQDTIPQLIIDTTFVPVYENQTIESKDEMRMRLQMVSIPVKFGYRFAFHKFYLYLGAGVRFNMPVSSNLRLLSGEGFLNTYTSVKDSPYNAFNMQLILETELQYRFNDRWGISIAPRYGYQLTSIYKSSITNNANKHMGGITVGLHYHF